MQTNLADFIRDTAQGEEAEAILRSCVHCGFCNATCPTYQLLGDELDGPRGRIYLMKQMLEGQPVTEVTRPSGPLPDLPQLRDHLPLRRAIWPADRHRP
jgi:glycolate oxidase iron-sulfur subunit